MLNGIANGFASLMGGLVSIMDSWAGDRTDYQHYLKQAQRRPMSAEEAQKADAKALASDMEALSWYKPSDGSEKYWTPSTGNYWPVLGQKIQGVDTGDHNESKRT
jgi:hypothetical protein